MKSLKEYINESSINESHVLSDDDRNQLIEIIGFASGNLGYEQDIKKYNKFIKTLSDEEIDLLNDLYDVVDNKETHPKLYKRIFSKDEIKLLNKLSDYVFDNDIDDLSEIMDKLQ